MLTTRRSALGAMAAGIAGMAIRPALSAQPDASTRACWPLQEAIDRGLDAIAARLDHTQAGRPFFYLHLEPQPRLEHQIWDLGDMCSRYVDAFILGRQATGNDKHADAESAVRKLLPTCDPYAHPFMAGRMLIAYIDLWMQERSDESQKNISDLLRRIRSKMTIEQDYAFFFRQKPGWRAWDQGLGDFTPYPTYPLGGIVLALARYVEMKDDRDARDLLDRLCRFILDHSGTFEPDGRYRGHTHSGGILTSIAGILRWAIDRGDAKTIQRMKNAFDWTVRYSTPWGWVPDGLCENPDSCETCAITDALHAGILLGRHVDPAYFDLVERFARNQLIENQFREGERLLPAGGFAGRERILRALNGSWASYSLPNSLDNCPKGVEGCCLGAGIRGCWLVLNASIEHRDDAVWVHMPFSRTSRWLDVGDFQPLEGRTTMTMHERVNLRSRIPAWAGLDQIQITINGTAARARLDANRYLVLDDVKPGDRIELRYPLRDEWQETIISGKTFKVRWLGNTVISIEPRGERYPLYERSRAEKGNPPAPGYRVPWRGEVYW